MRCFGYYDTEYPLKENCRHKVEHFLWSIGLDEGKAGARREGGRTRRSMWVHEILWARTNGRPMPNEMFLQALCFMLISW